MSFVCHQNRRSHDTFTGGLKIKDRSVETRLGWEPQIAARLGITLSWQQKLRSQIRGTSGPFFANDWWQNTGQRLAIG
jgi:hypothetical protein